MQRIVEALVAGIVLIHADDVVRFALIERTFRRLIHGLREELGGDPHFGVVSLTGKHGDRFVLGLPAETRDGAVVSAAVGNAQNAELFAELRGSSMTTEDLTVLNAIQHAQSE